MFKKMTAAILAIALVAAMWIVPSKASSFSDVPFFNVDFNSGSFNDISGNVTGEEAYYETEEEPITKAEFVQDDTIGRKVLRFSGESALFYTGFDYTKIQSNFTMEAYVNVPSRQSGWGYIAGSYWNTNPNAGICFTYGAHSTAGVGSNMAYNVIEGNGKTSQTFKGSRLLGGWMHLVYVHDGVNEYYYENGQLVTSQTAWCSAIPSVTDDANKAFRIGGYNRVSQFCANMDCAYVRVYSSAADSTDVAALYTNRNNDAPTPGAPTEAPSPTAIPSGKIFEVDFSTGAGDDTTGNYVVNQDEFSDNCTIALDEELGVNVAVFDGWGGINYTSEKNLYNYDLTSGITLEAYVNLNDVQHNMTFIETAGSGLHLQQYNDGSDTNVGLRCGDWVNDAYNMQNAYTEPGTILPAGKWAHLVGTSDGLTNRFYIDGQLVASVNRTQSLLKVPAGNTGNTKLTVGESVFGGMWGATQMEGKIAFARIYANAVDDAEAAELYYTVNPGARPADKKNVSLILVAKPSKLYYEIGEDLDLTGLVTATKIDGVKTPIALEDCTVTGFDSGSVGLCKLTVKYETEDTVYSNTFSVRILAHPEGITGVALVTKPSKLIYTVGEKLDTTGLSIMAKSADGTTEIISEGLEVTGYDSAYTDGIQRLTVSYQGATTSFSVKVVAA